MRSDEFLRRMSEALAVSRGGDVSSAVRQLAELEADAKADEPGEVSQEDLGDLSSLLAQLLETVGEKKEALERHRARAQRLEDEIRGKAVAAAGNLAAAVLLASDMGNNELALDLGKRCLALYALHADPSPTIEEMIRRLREIRMGQSKKKPAP